MSHECPPTKCTMNELKPCPTPRTDALRGEYARLKPYNWSSKFDKELSEKVSELERELIATQLALNDGIDGWVIVHPDGHVETDYFNITNFKTKLDGYKKTVTPEFWRLTYRPDCKLIRMRLVDLSNPLVKKAIEVKKC